MLVFLRIVDFIRTLANERLQFRKACYRITVDTEIETSRFQGIPIHRLPYFQFTLRVESVDLRFTGWAVPGRCG